jgi:hypothetical protein
MKTLFIALRSAVFGTGFIFLWGWVAWSLQRRCDTTLVPSRSPKHPVRRRYTLAVR